MADLFHETTINIDNIGTSDPNEFGRLFHNPMFPSLQATLLDDMNTMPCIFPTLSGADDHSPNPVSRDHLQSPMVSRSPSPTFLPDEPPNSYHTLHTFDSGISTDSANHYPYTAIDKPDEFHQDKVVNNVQVIDVCDDGKSDVDSDSNPGSGRESPEPVADYPAPHLQALPEAITVVPTVLTSLPVLPISLLPANNLVSDPTPTANGLSGNPVHVSYSGDHDTHDTSTFVQSTMHLNRINDDNSTPMKNKFDFIVENATLLAEFRQLSPLCNIKVIELENFYNAQSAQISNDRMNAISNLHFHNLSSEMLAIEEKKTHDFFDQMQEHLILRVSRSLQLLKASFPSESSKLGLHGGSISAKRGNKSRLLNSKAVAIMNQWYQQHIEYPYPTDEQKQGLADEGGISLAQVKAWFANKRNRSLNTKPKRQKAKLANELTNICQKLAHAKEVGGDVMGAKSYNRILKELSTMTSVKPPTVPKMPCLSALQQDYVSNYQPGPCNIPATGLSEGPFPFYRDMNMHHDEVDGHLELLEIKSG